MGSLLVLLSTLALAGAPDIDEPAADGTATSGGEEAAADPPPPEDPEPTSPPEEGPGGGPIAEGGEATMTVYGERVSHARRKLERSLTELGYGHARRRGDVVELTTDVPWEPKVLLHDDGWVQVKRRQAHMTDPTGKRWNESGASRLLCLLRPDLCVRIGGQIVSKAKAGAKKQTVLDAIGPELNEWTDAIADLAVSTRLAEELPAQLDGIWSDTTRSPEQRRAEILDLWVTRTDNTWGNAAREVIERFMRHEVDASPWPYTPDEIADANARRIHDQALDLGLASAPVLEPEDPAAAGSVEPAPEREQPPTE